MRNASPLPPHRPEGLEHCTATGATAGEGRTGETLVMITVKLGESERVGGLKPEVLAIDLVRKDFSSV